MPSKRVRIEVVIDDGSTLVMTSKDMSDRVKLIKFLDLAELMGGGSPRVDDIHQHHAENATLYDQVERLVRSRFPGRWFDFMQVRQAFEMEFGFMPRDTTIATYLQRLARRGVLRRRGRRGSYRYKGQTDPLTLSQE
ncbi:MAG: hypothetical protein ACE5KH_00575 [Candidatus Geothermarchaeales archaeon]